MTQLHIGFLIYPGVIQLDVMGAYQVLALPPNTQVHLIWKTLTHIVSNEGLTLTPTTTLVDCPPLTVICVPGGGLGQIEIMKDPEILEFLQQQANVAQYVHDIGKLIVEELLKLFEGKGAIALKRNGHKPIIFQMLGGRFD